MREAPGPSVLDEDEPSALHLAAVIRAFHAGEDLARLRALARRVGRAARRVPR